VQNGFITVYFNKNDLFIEFDPSKLVDTKLLDELNTSIGSLKKVDKITDLSSIINENIHYPIKIQIHDEKNFMKLLPYIDKLMADQKSQNIDKLNPLDHTTININITNTSNNEMNESKKNKHISTNIDGSTLTGVNVLSSSGDIKDVSVHTNVKSPESIENYQEVEELIEQLRKIIENDVDIRNSPKKYKKAMDYLKKLEQTCKDSTSSEEDKKGFIESSIDLLRGALADFPILQVCQSIFKNIANKCGIDI
jgi:hypothetical protein